MRLFWGGWGEENLESHITSTHIKLQATLHHLISLLLHNTLRCPCT